MYAVCGKKGKTLRNATNTRTSKNPNQVSDKIQRIKKKLPPIQIQSNSVIIEFRMQIPVEYILSPFK